MKRPVSKRVLFAAVLAALLVMGTWLLEGDFSPAASGGAQEPDVIANEYEALKSLSRKSSLELSQNGLSREEIRVIRNYRSRYRSHIESLNGLDDETLARCGYTDAQIGIIRNFTGTEQEMLDTAAVLELDSSAGPFQYEEGGCTTGSLTYRWSWSGIPLLQGRDMVLVRWDDWFLESEHSQITYFRPEPSEAEASGSGEALLLNFTNERTSVGSGHLFSLSAADGSGYAQSGTGTFAVSSDVFAAKDFNYYIAYYHLGGNAADSAGNLDTGGAITAYTPAASDRGRYRWETPPAPEAA